MDDKEKRELIDKILGVDSDAKSARVSATVFINKALPEDAKYFIDYLDHHNPAVKKIVRHVLGHVGVVEACPPLIKEFDEVVEKMTFMPDAEYKEQDFYLNLVDILETVFAIMRSGGDCGGSDFINRLDAIFKKTKNEDLRFTMIKLLGLGGGRLDYFMQIFDDLTEKERRGLYFVYTVVPDPKRLEVYRRGLSDERNFDYVVTNMLSFDEGRACLSEELLSLGNYNKQAVLKKLRDDKCIDFNDVLLKLLGDKNKFLVEMSIEILKNNITSEEELGPFIEMVDSGYSPEGINGALEIIAHCSKRTSPVDIYLSGLEKQPSNKNKNIILEFFIEQLKGNLKPTEELTEKVLPRLLVFFESHSKDKEDLYLSIFKIIPSLRYGNSSLLRNIKHKIVAFKKEFENRLAGPFKNNMGEFLVKINQLMSRFDEAESKKKNVSVLFDIDPTKIDHPRMMKLKEQLDDLDMDDAMHQKLVGFLVVVFDNTRVDWRVRSVAVELLGDHGGPAQIARLQEAGETESSLAIKVNAQKAAKKIEERCEEQIQNVLIVDPLPYVQKKLSELFKVRGYKVFVLPDAQSFAKVSEAPFRFLAVADAMMEKEGFTQQVFDYLDENFEAILIIITAKPELLEQFQGIPNIRFLKKPFNDELLDEVTA